MKTTEKFGKVQETRKSGDLAGRTVFKMLSEEKPDSAEQPFQDFRFIYPVSQSLTTNFFYEEKIVFCWSDACRKCTDFRTTGRKGNPN